MAGTVDRLGAVAGAHVARRGNHARLAVAGKPGVARAGRAAVVFRGVGGARLEVVAADAEGPVRAGLARVVARPGVRACEISC